MFTHVDLNLPELKTVYNDTGKRFYVTPEGFAYPSVTTVLGSITPPALRNWQRRVGQKKAQEITTAAANRGQSLHTIVENYLRNEENPVGNATETNVALFEQCKDPIGKHINNIYLIERPLYSDQLQLAGKPDIIADFDGVPSVIDMKTSTRNINKYPDKINKYFIQCWLYSVMFKERTGIIPTKAVVICVSSDHGMQIMESNLIEHGPRFALAYEPYHQEYLRKEYLKTCSNI